LAIILNVSTASTCNVTSVNSTPKVTAIDPVNKAIVLNTKIIKIKFNTPIRMVISLYNSKVQVTERLIPLKLLLVAKL
jgi:hypothetical protein